MFDRGCIIRRLDACSDLGSIASRFRSGIHSVHVASDRWRQRHQPYHTGPKNPNDYDHFAASVGRGTKQFTGRRLSTSLCRPSQRSGDQYERWIFTHPSNSCAYRSKLPLPCSGRIRRRIFGSAVTTDWQYQYRFSSSEYLGNRSGSRKRPSIGPELPDLCGRPELRSTSFSIAGV